MLARAHAGSLVMMLLAGAAHASIKAVDSTLPWWHSAVDPLLPLDPLHHVITGENGSPKVRLDDKIPFVIPNPCLPAYLPACLLQTWLNASQSCEGNATWKGQQQWIPGPSS